MIADTKPAAFLAWIAAEQKSGRAARTILQRLVMLSQSMKAAVDAGWIPAVPCAVPRPRVVAKSERTCTPEPQFEKLLKAATKSKGPRHPALLLLASDAGLRRGEIGRVLGRHVRLGSDELWTRAKLGPGSRLHELRHRWVTRLLDAGVPRALVMARAGHADLTTTLRYHHGVPDAPAGAGAALIGQERATNVPRTCHGRS